MDQHKPTEPLPSSGADSEAARADGTRTEDGGTPPPGAPGDPPRGRGRWVMAAVAALGVALFAVPFMRGPEQEAGPTAGVRTGGSCPAENGTANLDLTLKDMNGRDVRLADYKGKVVLLNFWATWCGPCRVEIPELVSLVEEHGPKGFEVLGISIDDTPEQLRAFAEETKMNYPSLLMDERLEEAFGEMFALPTTYIIDRGGTICLKHTGQVTKEMVEREITGLL